MQSVSSGAVYNALGMYTKRYSIGLMRDYKWEIYRFNVSAGSVTGISILISLFQDTASNYSFPMNMGVINLSSGAYPSAFNINGFFSIHLPNTFAIRVYKTSTQYILYLTSTYTYTQALLSFYMQLGGEITFTRRDNFEGTEIFNSNTNQGNAIKYLT